MLEQRLENLEIEVFRMSGIMSNMSETMTSLTVSIERLTAVITAGADIAPETIKEKATPLKKVESTSKKAAKNKEPEKTVTIEDVRTALIDLSKAKGKDAAKELLSEFAATKVGDLKESDYPKIYKQAIQRAEAA